MSAVRYSTSPNGFVSDEFLMMEYRSDGASYVCGRLRAANAVNRKTGRQKWIGWHSPYNHFHRCGFACIGIDFDDAVKQLTNHLKTCKFDSKGGKHGV